MSDTGFMSMAIGLSYGSFDPSSNKKVGCIIVKNGEIVGSGTRQVYIMKIKPYRDLCLHAEHIAIMEAGMMAKRATMYCTLEPCIYRNIAEINAIPPPKSCCQLIVDAEIERVVYLGADNYIGHGGEEFLKEHGIEVEKLTV